MGMEGLLQIAGYFHMGQLKKLTVKPFSVQTRTFPSKRNFGRHKVRNLELMLVEYQYHRTLSFENKSYNLKFIGPCIILIVE